MWTQRTTNCRQKNNTIRKYPDKKIVEGLI
mgnify:CR=1 FL=1